jgi:hypothetical protein
VSRKRGASSRKREGDTGEPRRPTEVTGWMNKEIVGPGPYLEEAPVDWLDLDSLAEVQVTSDDPDYPIESVFGAETETGWRSATPGPQTIWLHFATPQPIHEIHLRFEVTEPRTQEFTLCSSSDGGVTYHDIVRQQFNFCPGGATVEEETYSTNLSGVTDLKLNIVPDISGGDAKAELRSFRVR